MVRQNEDRVEDYFDDFNVEAEEENIKKEKMISQQIFQHFLDNEFGSISYFFENIPEPNLDYLKFNLTKEQIEFEKQTQISTLP